METFDIEINDDISIQLGDGVIEVIVGVKDNLVKGWLYIHGVINNFDENDAMEEIYKFLKRKYDTDNVSGLFFKTNVMGYVPSSVHVDNESVNILCYQRNGFPPSNNDVTKSDGDLISSTVTKYVFTHEFETY